MIKIVVFILFCGSHVIQYHVFKFFKCYFMVMIDVMFIHNLINLFGCHVVTKFCESIL